MSKTLPEGTVIQYIYGLDGALLAELDGFNTPIKEYVYFNGGLLAVRDMSSGIGTVYYAHNDHLGTPQLLTNQFGQVVWSAEYDPFGAAEVNEDPDGDGNRVTLNIRFPGQYLDVETGLHYNYFRYYDPETGKYITSDPIGLRGGINTYSYVGSNPISNIDPYGLYCLSNQQINAIAGGIGGAFVGFITGAQTGNPYTAAAGSILGGGFGAAFGFLGTSTEGQAMAAGASSSMMSGFTTPGGSVVGGALGGGISYNLQSKGMRDTYAGIIGGGAGGVAGGVVSGFMTYNAMRSAAKGGLAGLSGAALSAAITEALRVGNDCRCSQ